jgi:hypothetical protein
MASSRTLPAIDVVVTDPDAGYRRAVADRLAGTIQLAEAGAFSLRVVATFRVVASGEGVECRGVPISDVTCCQAACSAGGGRRR